MKHQPLTPWAGGIRAVVMSLSWWLAVTPLHAQIVNDGATRTLVNVTNNITGTVTVGTNGSFTLLTLADNALLTNSTHGVIGRNATAQFNEVRLLGASARWLMGNNLFVDSNGAGNRLVVSGGAFLNNNSGVLGNGASSSNNFALITGSGSFWTNRSDLRVGVFGRDNLLVISNGARVISFGGDLGSQPGGSNNLVVVTGSGSVWTNVLGGWVSVGAGERGNRLIIEAGGQVSGDSGVVGAGAFGGDSEALVTGPGSLWSSRTDLAVGLNPSNNRLVVSNGAAVTAGNNGRLGAVTGATNNVVVVTGTGSQWSNQFDLYVGEGGPRNRMEVSNGGRVVSSNTYIGYFGASNVALVTGAGSVWSNRAGMFVGHAGPGNQLLVSNGGLVISSNTVLGVLGSSSNNLLRVSGVGSFWSNRSLFTVGQQGRGNRLEVRDGGRLSLTSGDVGQSLGSDGNEVLIADAGSVLDVGFFVFGNFGAGNRLRITGGGSLKSGIAAIGRNGTGLNNEAIIADAGSSFSSDLLYLGSSGSGVLLLTNGGTFQSPNADTLVGPQGIIMGFSPASTNNRIVVDGGTLRAANVRIDSTLDIRGGTNVLNAGLIDADRLIMTNAPGRFEFKGGTLITRGAFLTNGSGMVVGAAGGGSAFWDVQPGPSDHYVSLGVVVGNASPFNQMLISDGALLTNGVGGFIGLGGGANGNTATVIGPGSRWQVAGQVNTGAGGSLNTLTVSDGGRVDATNGIVGDAGSGNEMQISSGGLVVSGSGSIGRAAAASANTAQITDAGSRWLVGSDLFVGNSGSGNRLVVSGGGLVDDLIGWVGNSAGSSNNLALVSGSGSVWSNRANVIVGFSGAGNQLLVTNGGRVVNVAGGTIGSQVSAPGNVATVTGNGSVWSSGSGLSVCNLAANNRLVIEGGGQVDCNRGVIGFGTGSSNVALVTGAGSVWSNASLQVGGFGPHSQLIVSNSGKVIVAGDGIIGMESSAANSSVSVAGTGARLEVGGNFHVGSNGILNRLVVSNGGFMSSFSGLVGYESGASNNTALVTGPGTVWSNVFQATSGYFGNGNALTVNNGAELLCHAGFVGATGSENLGMVTGPGSSWQARDTFSVGGTGDGNRLVIANGALVSDDTGIVGTSGSGNLVTVTGAGSLWSNRFELRVGSSGGGNRLDIQSGATVFGSNVFVGKNSSSFHNRLTVNGGTLRATCADGTGLLDVRRGTNVINAGLVDVDRLVLTNRGAATAFPVFVNGNFNLIPFEQALPSLYPSTIAVTGLLGRVTKVSVTLSNFYCGVHSSLLNVLLVSPTGKQVMLMSDAGQTILSHANLTLDDSAATLVPNTLTPIASGTYRPTDYEPGDTLPAPAPTGPYSSSLSAFNGDEANGLWSLYFHTKTGVPNDIFMGGWRLNITTDEVPLIGPAMFELNGGTLITRGAVISNGVQFVVGGSGGVPAVWEARAGLTDTFVARDLLVGKNSSFNQLVIPSGVVIANQNVFVGSLAGGSSNNLLRVTGGTLRVLTPGRVLDLRGGTNRIDAGLVDVNRLVVTNTHGQFEMFGGTFRSPSTTVANGRVCVIGGGTNLATYQMLGGTHTFANNLTIATNGSLIGTATIDGTVTVSPGGRLTPGAPIGSMDVLGSVILQGAVNLQIDKSGGVRTSDEVTADGAIFYDGALNVTDIGTDVLSAGDRFFLFNATPYIGAFTTLNLPPLASGLSWRNNLSVDGSIEVTTAVVSTPGFSAITRTGTNVVITGTNGTPNAPYTVLASTNVALPLSSWVSIATNQFNASGGFTFTNAITPGIPQRFFQLRTP